MSPSPRKEIPARLFVASVTAISLGLGLGLCLGVAGPAVAIPTATATVDNVIYKATSGTEVSVMGFSTGAIPTTLTIPSQVTLSPGGLRNVTNIASNAFLNRSTLVSVSLPDTITAINSNSFSGATALTAISFGNTLKTIGMNAFANDPALTALDFPDSLTSIGIGAFDGSTALARIGFGTGLLTINNAAFSNCPSLTAITIPASVTKIGDLAFSVTAPGTSALTSVTFLGAPPAIITAPGEFGSLGTAAGLTVHFSQSFLSPGYAGGFTIPTWHGYDSQAIPYTITYQVNTGTGSPSVDTQQYFGDSPLTLATVGTMEKAGYSFEGWSTSAGDANGVGASVIDGSYAPDGSLTLYAVWKLIPLPVTATINGLIYTQTTATSTTVSVTGNTITAPIDLVIPESVQIEGDTYDVTAIAGAAFTGNSNLKSVVIPDTVASIGEQAFQSTPALTSVTMGAGVTSIGGFAFYSSALTTITLGGSVTSLGDYAFSENPHLASVSFNAGLTSMGEGAFYDDPALTEVVLPDSLTSLGEWAFAQDAALHSVTLGSGVTVVSNAAFQNATSLTTVNFGPSVRTIGHWAFDGATALRHVVIPATVTFIGQGAYGDNDNLTSVTFQGAPPLAFGDYLQYPGFWGAETGTPSFGNTANVAVYFGSEFAAPSLVGGFTTPLWEGYHAALSPTTIDNVVYEITSESTVAAVENTLVEPSALEIPGSVTIDDVEYTVTAVGFGAFENIPTLASVVLPASITSIASSAFSECPLLTNVTFRGAPPTILTEAGEGASLGSAVGLTVHYRQAFLSPGYAGGFTSPTWTGYDTEMIPFATPTFALGLVFSPGQAAAGAPVTFGVDGLQVDSEWSLSVHSTPQILDAGMVGILGVVSGTVTLPDGLESGWHRLIFNGYEENGSPVESVIWFSVNASGQLVSVSPTEPTDPGTDSGTDTGETTQPAAVMLANTGTNAFAEPSLALLLLAAGVALSALRRRRSRAKA